jgi:TolB-like protein
MTVLMIAAGGAVWRSVVHESGTAVKGTSDAEADARIAILPFENLSRDLDSQPFVDGLHEDLIIRLSNIEGLIVISKGSAGRFAPPFGTIRDIAEQLGVSAVLQAGVQRSGSTVRLTAQLVDGATDVNLWADGYLEEISVDNVFDVQAQLVEHIATALAKQLTPDERAEIRTAPTSDPEAFELYVRGRDSWLRLTDIALVRSVEYLTAATERDPEFARAFSALADVYLAMEFVGALPLEEAVALARESVEQALASDPESGEALSALGHVLLHERRGPEAEQELRRAVSLNPSFVDAHMLLSMALLDWGRLDEAEEPALQALRIDPLSTYGAWGEGLFRLAMDDYRGAAEHFQRAVELQGLWVGHYELAWAYSALEDHGRAVSEMETALSKASGALAREFGLESTVAAFRARAGDTATARATLVRLADSGEAPFAMGLAYAALGDLDRSFDLWLNATEWTILLPAHFRYGPLLDPVRDDPRYPAVIDRIRVQTGW